MSDSEIDELNAQVRKKPSAELRFGEEHLANLKVAEQMGKGATVLDACALPLIEWSELLVLRLAEIEAGPEIQKRAEAEAEARAKEKEQSAPT